MTVSPNRASTPRAGSLLTRRRFLTLTGGVTAGAVLLGACGDDDDVTAGGDGDDATTSTTAPAGGDLALAQFFGGPMFVAGQVLRAPFGLADADGLVALDATPERLSVAVLDPDGDELEVVDVARRAEGLPRPYFPLTFTPPEPGIYTARAEVDGTAAEMAIMVDAEADVLVIQPGAAMPAVQTATTADARGIDPLCTNDPVCSLHDASVADVLQEGVPMALLIATPAFCQIAICGPVLDVLLDVAEGYPDIRFVHVEVYAAPERDLETYAPIVGELGLHFEPCLILVGADGTVTERVDTIYDRSELDERLAALA